MDLEEKYDAISTFFFMAENPWEQDYTYDIEDLEPEIKNIINRGWEVGLHGGHTTYLNPNDMREKKERLEKVTRKPVFGYRNHFLRFRVPDSWEYLSQAGFQYDSTVGYADCAGFRNGMCHPYRPIDLNTNKEIDIFEIPLILMDITLDQTYMRLEGKSKWEFIKMLIDRNSKCHGLLTILWHNSSIRGQNLEIYRKILEYCYEKGACMTSCEKIIHHIIPKNFI